MLPLLRHALATLAVALVCGAGAAYAASTSVSTEQGMKGGPITSVFYFAEAGEANRLFVSGDGARYVFEDLGAQITPGRCEGGGRRVSCGAEGRFGQVSAFLGDGDDELTLMPSAGLTTGSGGAGDDVLRATKSDDYGLLRLTGEEGDDVLATKRGGELLGGPGADRLDGGAEAATLDGGPGADRLLGGGGNDFLNPGPDDDADLVDGGGGRDHVSFLGRKQRMRVDMADLRAVGADRLRSIEDLTGGDAGDSLRGGPAAERLDGGGGSDKVRGGGGRDGLSGGQGDDDIAGGPGDDRISDWYGVDSFAGGSGDDRIDPWTFQEEPERERISCGSGRDVLFYYDSPDPFEARFRPVPADCELLEVDASMLAPFRPVPRVAGGVASWSLLCARATRNGACPTTLEVHAGGAFAGRGSVRLRPRRRATLRVPLNDAGRRAVRRGDKLAVTLRMVSDYGFIGFGDPRAFEVDLP